MKSRIFTLLILITSGILCMGKMLENKSLTESKAEIYPMPMFCTLIVENVKESANWYSKTLGFSVIFAIEHPETKEMSFIHLRREKYQDILLVKGKTEKENNAYGIAITFQAWCDVDSLTKKAQENGALVIAEPHDTPWNTREVTFQDLDGYRITFTYPGKALAQKIFDKNPESLSSKSWEQ